VSAPRGDDPLRFKTLDGFRKGPGIGPHASHRADLARCSRLRDKLTLWPYDPLVRPTGQGWHRTRAPPIYLRTSSAREGRRAMVNRFQQRTISS
jgi:hypothetical protein